MCSSPILISKFKNKRKYRFLRDDQIELVSVPCGKCEECQKRMRMLWTFRINEELKYSLMSSFVTLTYDDEHVPENFELVSDHVKKLFKGIRNSFRDKKDWFKYLCVGEHGDSFGRCHWHFIFCCNWSFPIVDFMQLVYDYWPYGNVFFGNVTDRSIMYVAKYCVKSLRSGDIKLLVSKKIGEKWIEFNREFLKRNLQLYVTDYQGHKLPIPRTWKNKIFTRAEYLEALDYCLGSIEEDDITGAEEYQKRELNREKHDIYVNTRKQKLIKSLLNVKK